MDKGDRMGIGFDRGSRSGVFYVLCPCVPFEMSTDSKYNLSFTIT